MSSANHVFRAENLATQIEAWLASHLECPHDSQEIQT
jgi:hypothetical protein